MRIATSVAASAHHLEDDLLVDGLLLQVVMACFAARDDFAVRACFVELGDFVGLDESAVCSADLAGCPAEFRFLGYTRAECRVCLRGDCPVCIRDGCLAYLRADCRVCIQGGCHIRGECRDDSPAGSLRACCSRDGCRSLADGS